MHTIFKSRSPFHQESSINDVMQIFMRSSLLMSIVIKVLCTIVTQLFTSNGMTSFVDGPKMSFQDDFDKNDFQLYFKLITIRQNAIRYFFRFRGNLILPSHVQILLFDSNNCSIFNNCLKVSAYCFQCKVCLVLLPHLYFLYQIKKSL